MDYLWTPWRYRYISEGAPGEPGRCIFCEAARGTDDEAALIVRRAPLHFVVLNRYPYTNGHMMVVPYRHAATLEELPEETLGEMMRLGRDCEKALRDTYHPDGFNLGLNIGKSAGAGVAGHIHLHALPRWTGDSNFMTPIAETRILPEELAVTLRRLREAFSRL